MIPLLGTQKTIEEVICVVSAVNYKLPGSKPMGLFYGYSQLAMTMGFQHS